MPAAVAAGAGVALKFPLCECLAYGALKGKNRTAKDRQTGTGELLKMVTT